MKRIFKNKRAGISMEQSDGAGVGIKELFKRGRDILIKRKILIILFITPVLYFFGIRLERMIFQMERTESLKSEIITAIIFGCTMSLYFWYLDRKSRKEKDSQAKDSHTK
jgi:hypothetical protein